ncbi:winged helix-turn-helix domain-containing protein [Pseudomonas koreensis]|uniref:winged helix-turn-helix domain-containing protein n=1 Tax=Pseudomonas koreensis TaxID=198620 RepID=UPI001B33A792|nr:winged helix-turn-helix domain-containing protein [Pseudomonas koreensis]MBP3996506.1 winged helix-turn-helix domain-containing protein [Pseudomonas koreensis]
MCFVFRLKKGKLATFSSENYSLSISLPDKTVEHLTLGRTESRLLFFLLSAAGDTRSRTEIIEYVWDDRVVGPGSLNQAIFSLRSILDDNTDHEILITVPRRGYRFNQSRVVGELDVAPVTMEENIVLDPPALTPPAHDRLAVVLSNIKEVAGTKKLVMGYLALLPLVFVAIDHVSTIDGSRVQISNLESNNVTLHFMAATLSKAWDFKAEAEKEVLNLPNTLSGEAWLIQNKTGYSISCIRPDQSTNNLSFLSRQLPVSGAIQKCLEKAL